MSAPARNPRFSGSRALYFSGAGAVSPSGFSTWTKEKMYGRMMLYFEGLPTGPIPAHFILVRAEGNGWMRFGGQSQGSGSWNETSTTGCCWSVSPVQKIRFGYESYHPTTGPLSMWMDDVAISEERIGCPEGTGQ